MTFIHYQKNYNKNTLGQNWTNQTISERINLCEHHYVKNYIIKYINDNHKILEAGCGTGSWVFYLNKMGFDIEGIDLSKNAVDIAKSHDPQIRIYNQDIQKTKYPDNYFDVILSFGVLEHFINGPQKALSEFKRIIKDDGILILTVPTQNIVRYLFINHIKRIRDFCNKLLNNNITFGEYRYSKNKFIKILNENKIIVTEIAPDDFKYPKSLGFYMDFPFLRNKNNKFELNIVGRIIEKFLKNISPNICCAGTIFVCKLKISQQKSNI